MLKTVKLNDPMIAEIIGGQIMTRLSVKDEYEGVVEQGKVIIPKCILNDGTIAVNELPLEKLKALPDEKKITKEGDIVIKLSTPYDSAIITEETAGCIVPSFCAIIRCNDIEREYLQAFLSTDECKNQLKKQIAGALVTLLSVGKLGNIDVPYPNKALQKRIGEAYVRNQEKVSILKRIIELENKKNDAIFKELTR